jgi:hypothetical protein
MDTTLTQPRPSFSLGAIFYQCSYNPAPKPTPTARTFPPMIINPPEVTGIVLQRLIGAGFKINSAKSTKTREEPPDG